MTPARRHVLVLRRIAGAGSERLRTLGWRGRVAGSRVDPGAAAAAAREARSASQLQRAAAARRQLDAVAALPSAGPGGLVFWRDYVAERFGAGDGAIHQRRKAEELSAVWCWPPPDTPGAPLQRDRPRCAVGVRRRGLEAWLVPRRALLDAHAREFNLR